MDVELRHLRAFTAVATHCSFTAAGRELLITQPALTRTVQHLEAALGQQDLRLGFPWVLPDPWITETITGFEQATGATVTLLRRDDVDTGLERGDLDVAVTRTRLTAPGTVQTPLFDEDRVAAVAPAPRWRSGTSSTGWSWPGSRSSSTPPTAPPSRTPAGRAPPDAGGDLRQLRRVAAGGRHRPRRGRGAPVRRPHRHPPRRRLHLPGRRAPPVSVCLAYRPRRGNPLVRRFVDVAATAASALPL
ncbi:LysR family transcriptional regulator [Geodermatophilus sp. SYSU D01176]